MSMQSRSIVPLAIRVEERSGTDILVVEDGNQDQYTTGHPHLVNSFKNLSDEQEERYIGTPWIIAYSIVKKDGNEYRDFEGFLRKDISQEEVSEGLENRIDSLEDRMANLEQTLGDLTETISEVVEGE